MNFSYDIIRQTDKSTIIRCEYDNKNIIKNCISKADIYVKVKNMDVKSGDTKIYPSSISIDKSKRHFYVNISKDFYIHSNGKGLLINKIHLYQLLSADLI